MGRIYWKGDRQADETKLVCRVVVYCKPQGCKVGFKGREKVSSKVISLHDSTVR